MSQTKLSERLRDLTYRSDLGPDDALQALLDIVPEVEALESASTAKEGKGLSEEEIVNKFFAEIPRPVTDDFEVPPVSVALALMRYLRDHGYLGSGPRAGEQWIPVSERLPERLWCVLVWVDALNEKSAHIGSLTIGGEWQVWDERGNHAIFITHWMPLPSPPDQTTP